MENRRPCELTRPHNGFKAQLLLLLLLHQSALLCGFFFLFHDLPNITRDCPVIHRYVPLFALLLVKIVMLANVCTTRRVSPLVEGFALAVRFYEGLVTSGQW